ncbi:N-acetylmuramic acid 6-phosphate etherase [Gemmobacter fulvus]|uniref:N-acetylmuramic acid 6-phosphate etherase n=1 Tax=Gemmobacter fulvus TaxID=2840474 RepID=A0A975P3I9_9RHOB|nr:N-acetylmuramic acid 6-phosphate etherase [Gemmobacter fulvus]MBT9246853.1 N-acetylmuramic acid 6-phosphate etherase [Gemmobacter fulvus]QWK89055.1 N-acetylmuramic acid 6-phosphate etherase [Gemmobacter fulvus]
MTAQSTEARHPASAGFHALTDAQALSTLLDAQMSALTAVRAAFPALEQAAARSVDVLRAGGKMAYAGAGSSGLMALADSLELAGTFGIAPDRTPLMFAGGAAALLHLTGAVEDDPDLARVDLAQAGIGAGDVVLCLSASGTTPYTLVVAREAAARGATIVGFANVAGSALLDLADIPVLLDTGAEVVSGSTRMGAATAQKAALNLLSALVGVRLGHVHDGYMVNLIADNAKLVDRAARIVADISGVSRAMAEAALAQTGGAVKPAILVARGQSPAEAKAALAESGGHLSAALTR